MVSDKTIHKALELRKLYKQNPLETFFIFTIYQNYTLALRKKEAPIYVLSSPINFILAYLVYISKRSSVCRHKHQVRKRW